MYRTLDSARIVETLERLDRRIAERFPNAGLTGVCAELVSIARRTAARIADISRPIVWLRALTAAILLGGLGSIDIQDSQRESVLIHCASDQLIRSAAHGETIRAQ
jgi:hypothetical protein